MNNLTCGEEIEIHRTELVKLAKEWGYIDNPDIGERPLYILEMLQRFKKTFFPSETEL